MNLKFWQWKTPSAKKIQLLEWKLERVEEKLKNVCLVLDFDRCASMSDNIFVCAFGSSDNSHSIDIGDGKRRVYSQKGTLQTVENKEAVK